MIKNIEYSSIPDKHRIVEPPEKDFFKTVELQNINESMIGSIVSSQYYINSNMPIVKVADNLISREDISSIGIVDNNNCCVGIVDRQYLFDIIGKPFGRDLSLRKTISEIAIFTTTFDYTSNIFSIAEKLGDELYGKKIKYYLLENHEHHFKGIFSTRDLLIYLSKMMRKDIQIARHLQLSIVPEKTIHENKNIALIGSSLMAKGVGGDHYSLTKHNNNSWMISICDVSGKGIGASLLTSIIDGMINIYNFSQPLEELIESLNTYIYNNFDSDKFITGAFAEINEESGETRLFDLGHSHVYLLRDKKIVKINSRKENIPIGIMKNYKPYPITFKLKKEEILILLTDGIIEEENTQGIPFGIERFAKIILQNRNQGLVSLQSILLENVISYRGGLPQHDDITLVMLEKR